MEDRDVQVYKDELLRKIDEFGHQIIEGTSDPDHFLTIFEIEKLWSELRGDTSILYSDMLADLLAAADESELIRKKKQNSGKKGSF